MEWSEKNLDFPGVPNRLNSFYVTALLKLAARSGDSRWIPILEKLGEKWHQEIAGWEKQAPQGEAWKTYGLAGVMRALQILRAKETEPRQTKPGSGCEPSLGELG